MNVSLFELFKIGIGPSSSHTIGPMWAANRFLLRLQTERLLEQTRRIRVTLYGSLALTGIGHGTDKAVVLGLCGEVPDKIDPDAIAPLLERVRETGTVCGFGDQSIAFAPRSDLIFAGETVLDAHPNGMTFQALAEDGRVSITRTYFSVGGGFVVNSDDMQARQHRLAAIDNIRLPYPFGSARELLETGAREDLSIAEIMRANEGARFAQEEISEGIHAIAAAMESSIDRGCRTTGELPGGLRIRRRAPQLYDELSGAPEASLRDHLCILDWVNLYALAVNEENAAGGRVVTAPTNGAAGVIPAVLRYYRRFCPQSTDAGIETFLLTAAAIGSLYKENASISAAEVGCQGEVGVACSMAAGALAAVMGGSNEQIENAAEIGMEHNLGLTCDPIGGLVQIPCIERNTMGAVKAINAARLALRGDGKHFVSLDQVIETMRQTGRDMTAKYKETSQGGLAVNVVEC